MLPHCCSCQLPSIWEQQALLPLQKKRTSQGVIFTPSSHLNWRTILCSSCKDQVWPRVAGRDIPRVSFGAVSVLPSLLIGTAVKCASPGPVLAPSWISHLPPLCRPRRSWALDPISKGTRQLNFLLKKDSKGSFHAVGGPFSFSTMDFHHSGESKFCY